MVLTDVEEDFPEHPDPVLQRRFPTNDVFFKYHSMKAKVRFHDPDEHDILRLSWELQDEVELEWMSMDLYTAGEWAELRARLLHGNRWYLRSVAAAHLFKRGAARLIWRDGLGYQRRECSEEPPETPMPPKKNLGRMRHSMTESSGDECETPPLPLTPSIFHPVKHKHRVLAQANRTIFVRIPENRRFRPHEIADACRSKAGSVQRNVCEDAQILSPSVCIVRLRRRNVARKLIGQYIRVDNDEMEVRRYPKNRPQIYVAKIVHYDPNGIRVDSILLNIASAIKKIPFYAWNHFVEDEMLWICVVAFEQPLDLLGFDVDVQTVGSFHVLAQFDPATKLGSCSVCRDGEHAILKCDMLEEVQSLDVPDELKGGNYLYEAPGIV